MQATIPPLLPPRGWTFDDQRCPNNLQRVNKAIEFLGDNYAWRKDHPDLTLKYLCLIKESNLKSGDLTERVWKIYGKLLRYILEHYYGAYSRAYGIKTTIVLDDTQKITTTSSIPKNHLLSMSPYFRNLNSYAEGETKTLSLVSMIAEGNYTEDELEDFFNFFKDGRLYFDNNNVVTFYRLAQYFQVNSILNKSRKFIDSYMDNAHTAADMLQLGLENNDKILIWISVRHLSDCAHKLSQSKFDKYSDLAKPILFAMHKISKLHCRPSFHNNPGQITISKKCLETLPFSLAEFENRMPGLAFLAKLFPVSLEIEGKIDISHFHLIEKFCPQVERLIVNCERFPIHDSNILKSFKNLKAFGFLNLGFNSIQDLDAYLEEFSKIQVGCLNLEVNPFPEGFTEDYLKKIAPKLQNCINIRVCSSTFPFSTLREYIPKSCGLSGKP